MAVYIGSLAEDTQEMIDHLEVSYTAPYEFIYLEGEQPNMELENNFIDSMTKEIEKVYNVKVEYLGSSVLEDLIISEWYFVRLK